MPVTRKKLSEINQEMKPESYELNDVIKIIQEKESIITMLRLRLETCLRRNAELETEREAKQDSIKDSEIKIRRKKDA